MSHRPKKLVVESKNEMRHELVAETIEQALRDFAKQVKRGEVEVPCTLEFDGPAGSKFTIAIETVEAAHEITTLGFMY